MPQEGGDLLVGTSEMARSTPVWLGWVVIGVVLGAPVLGRAFPEVSGNVWFVVWSLLLVMLLGRNAVALRSARKRSPERERLKGMRWLLIGALILCLPQPLHHSAAAAASVAKWVLALLPLTIAFERLVLQPMRTASARRRT